jgi:lipopolysaccharide cholinephosphotransferase
MSQIIRTARGELKFEPISLFNGRKKIDRKIARENLLDIEKLLSKSQLNWGLVYGTLLGAVREGNFIEHDEDTDIFIFDEDRASFLSLLFDINNLGFEIARYEDSLLSIIRHNEYIDFYFFKKSYSGRRSGEYFIPKNFFTSFDQVILFDCNFPTLGHHVDFLVHTYGVDWRTPKKGSHASGHPVIWKRFLKKYFPKCVSTYKRWREDGSR